MKVDLPSPAKNALSDSVPAQRTIIIVDDHKIIRDGLRALIEQDPSFRVVADAADGRAAIPLVLEHNPDVVIFDMTMPNLNGVQAIHMLRTEGFTGGIIMLTMHSEQRIIAQAKAAGADAYVLKEFAFSQVKEAILAAAEHKFFISPQLIDNQKIDDFEPLTEALTHREREVLQLLAEGHSAKEIAYQLALSSKTIDVHRANIMAKLKCDNIADLVRIAVREGLAAL